MIKINFMRSYVSANGPKIRIEKWTGYEISKSDFLKLSKHCVSFVTQLIFGLF